MVALTMEQRKYIKNNMVNMASVSTLLMVRITCFPRFWAWKKKKQKKQGFAF